MKKKIEVFKGLSKAEKIVLKGGGGTKSRPSNGDSGGPM